MDKKTLLPVPTEVSVGAHTYKVIVEEADDLNDDNLNAQVNHRLQNVRINKLRPDSVCSEGFIHEIVHLVSTKYLERDLSEHEIKLLSEGLTQVLQSAGVEFDWAEAKRR